MKPLHRRPRAAAALLALQLAAISAALAADRWVDLPPMPAPRQELGVAALDGKVVYVIGGIDAARGALGLVERFDLESGRWETLPPLPEGTRLHHIGAAAAAGEVYSIGGLNAAFRGVRDVFAFDPAAGEWRRAADLPWPRGAMGVAELAGRIYVAGGQDGGTSFKTAAAYIPGEDRWEPLPDMPTARNHLAGAAAGGLFFAIAGRAGGLRDQVEAYDPARGEWEPRAPIPTARGGLAAAALGGRIYAFGGEGNSARNDGIFPQTEVYDPSADRWRPAIDMAHPRHGIGAAALDDRISIPGGSPVEGFGVTAIHDAWVPDPAPAPALFKRGDANAAGPVDISDAVFTLMSLFVAHWLLPCEDAADADDDGTVQIVDAVFLLDFLFRGGPSPPPPGPAAAGPDPTADDLGCERPAAAEAP